MDRRALGVFCWSLALADGWRLWPTAGRELGKMSLGDGCPMRLRLQRPEENLSPSVK